MTSSKESAEGAKDEIYQELLKQIGSAKDSIYAELFVLTQGDVVDNLIVAHRRLTKQGKEGVKFLVDPGLFFAFPNTRKGVQRLAKAGIPIKFYEANKEAMDAGTEVLWPDGEPYIRLMEQKVSGGEAAHRLGLVGVEAAAEGEDARPAHGASVPFSSPWKDVATGPVISTWPFASHSTVRVPPSSTISTLRPVKSRRAAATAAAQAPVPQARVRPAPPYSTRSPGWL